MPSCSSCGAEFLTDHGRFCSRCGLSRFFDIVGSVTIADSGGFDVLEYCGTGAFVDIRAGTPVTLHDQDDLLIGTAVLGSGHGLGDSCVFLFRVKDIPHRDRAIDLYTVTVGERVFALSPQEVKDLGGVHIRLDS